MRSEAQNFELRGFNLRTQQFLNGITNGKTGCHLHDSRFDTYSYLQIEDLDSRSGNQFNSVLGL